MYKLGKSCMVIRVSEYTVAVSGATGYAGGEMLRLLSAHPNINVTTVCGHSTAGDPLSIHQPHLTSYANLTIKPSTPTNLAGHDIVILALPHGASSPTARELETISPHTLIVDLAADHRLELAHAWETYYHSPHPGTWTYGLPELIRATGPTQRELLATTTHIAVPGCNVTAVTLATQPLIQAGLIDHTNLTAVLANGVSGAGKALKPHLLAAEILGNAHPYSAGGTHRHIPEIEQNLAHVLGEDPVQATTRITFVPTLVPMSRGILATITAPTTPATATPDHLHETLTQAYQAEPFVKVLEPGQWPQTSATVGAHTAHIQATVDTRTGHAVIVAAIDNLVRGTAGQAIQSINLALGLPETTGLTGLATQGVAP